MDLINFTSTVDSTAVLKYPNGLINFVVTAHVFNSRSEFETFVSIKRDMVKYGYV